MPEEAEQQPDPTDVVVTCSHCGGAVQIPADTLESSITCPHCNQVFVAAAPGEQEIIDDTEPDVEEEVEVDDGVLDDNRIKQLAALRRSLYRSRSYCIVGVIAGVVTGIQLILNAIDVIRDGGPRGKSTGFILCAVAAIITALFLLRKARTIHGEIRAMHHVEEPTVPPDFAPLSDGSQRWKNLEDMSRGQ